MRQILAVLRIADVKTLMDPGASSIQSALQHGKSAEQARARPFSSETRFRDFAIDETGQPRASTSNSADAKSIRKAQSALALLNCIRDSAPNVSPKQSI